MKQINKDKLKGYGKVICDFVNAKTTDDLFNSFFSHICNVFNFSEDVREKAIKNFLMFINLDPNSNRHISLLKDTQELFKSILLQLIESEQAFKFEDFTFILNEYNEIPKTLYAVNDDNILTEVSPFNEEYIINDNIMCLNHKNKPIILRFALVFCFIEFFKDSEYNGRERLSVCSMCNCIFIKSKLNNQQHYCPVCSRKNKMTREDMAKYMKEYRANPVRIKVEAKKKREEKIKHLIKNAGKTRKEAENIIDNNL